MITDRFVRIRYSTDGGHTWSSWRMIHLGEVGQYRRRRIARQFGMAPQWVFQISVSSPLKVDLLAASAKLSGAQS